MITERTLRQWRRDALYRKGQPQLIDSAESLNIQVIYETELCNRILRLTQELLDQHLMKGSKSR